MSTGISSASVSQCQQKKNRCFWLESHPLLCLSLSSCFLSLAPPPPVPSCTCLALAPIERFTHGELWAWGIVCLLLDINASNSVPHCDSHHAYFRLAVVFLNASDDFRATVGKTDVVFPEKHWLLWWLAYCILKKWSHSFYNLLIVWKSSNTSVWNNNNDKKKILPFLLAVVRAAGGLHVQMLIAEFTNL